MNDDDHRHEMGEVTRLVRDLFRAGNLLGKRSRDERSSKEYTFTFKDGCQLSFSLSKHDDSSKVTIELVSESGEFSEVFEINGTTARNVRSNEWKKGSCSLSALRYMLCAADLLTTLSVTSCKYENDAVVELDFVADSVAADLSLPSDGLELRKAFWRVDYYKKLGFEFEVWPPNVIDKIMRLARTHPPHINGIQIIMSLADELNEEYGISFTDDSYQPDMLVPFSGDIINIAKKTAYKDESLTFTRSEGPKSITPLRIDTSFPMKPPEDTTPIDVAVVCYVSSLYRFMNRYMRGMPLNVEDKFEDMSSRRKRVYACALILWASDCQVVHDDFHPFKAKDVKETHMRGIHVWEEGARASRYWDLQLREFMSQVAWESSQLSALSDSVSVTHHARQEIRNSMYRTYERQKPYYSAFKQCVKKACEHFQRLFFTELVNPLPTECIVHRGADHHFDRLRYVLENQGQQNVPSESTRNVVPTLDSPILNKEIAGMSRSFVSTSLTPVVAEDFLLGDDENAAPSTKCCMFVIKLPKGARVLNVSSLRRFFSVRDITNADVDEQEIVLPAGVRYKIESFDVATLTVNLSADFTNVTEHLMPPQTDHLHPDVYDPDGE